MVRSNSTDMWALQRQVKALQEKSIDKKNRLHRNNDHAFGNPERAEGLHAAKFVKTFLTTLLDLMDLPPQQ